MQQADQRKGRTGRTCDGHVYRLVTGSFFSELEDYESPAILRLSLRQQVLFLCCSASKAINDPKGKMQFLPLIFFFVVEGIEILLTLFMD